MANVNSNTRTLALDETVCSSNAQEDGGTDVSPAHVGRVACATSAPSMERGATGVDVQQVRPTAGPRRQRDGGAIMEAYASNHALAVVKQVTTLPWHFTPKGALFGPIYGIYVG